MLLIPGLNPQAVLLLLWGVLAFCFMLLIHSEGGWSAQGPGQDPTRHEWCWPRSPGGWCHSQNCFTLCRCPSPKSSSLSSWTQANQLRVTYEQMDSVQKHILQGPQTPLPPFSTYKDLWGYTEPIWIIQYNLPSQGQMIATLIPSISSLSSPSLWNLTHSQWPGSRSWTSCRRAITVPPVTEYFLAP